MSPRRPDSLDVFLDSQRVGELTDLPDGRVGFAYDDEYRDGRASMPVSMSLPLSAERHEPAVVSAYLWGLLPDNEDTVQRLALEAGTSGRDLYGLMAYVGRDTAGALVIVPRGEDPDQGSAVEPITDSRLAQLVAEVRRLQRRGGAARLATGRWSLPGAQGKLALRYADGRWGVPRGSEPTTHILKPAVDGFDDFDLVEAIALNAASMLGLPAAGATVLRLTDDTTVLVSARYDRRRLADGRWVRLHQEDLCQALGVHPSRKYEDQGGPGLARVGRLLAQLGAAQSRDSALRMFDALAFTYAIANTDGHAKNYSLLLPGPAATLAPLYDVGSALPYTRPFGRKFDSVRKLHAAVRHGRVRAFTRIDAAGWSTVAEQLGLDPDMALDRVRHLLSEAPAAMTRASDELAARLDRPTSIPWGDLLVQYRDQLHPSVTDGVD